MPTYGEKQNLAGEEIIHSCPLCEQPESTTMRVKSRGFKIVPPEYKGNAVLNAQRS